MKVRSLFVALIALLSHGWAIQIPYHDCDRVNSAAAFQSLVLLDCFEQPCVFAPGKDLNFEIAMKLNNTVETFSIDISTSYYDKAGNKVRVATETVQPPNCKKNKCRIRAGDTRCIHPKLRTKEKIAALYDMKALLYDPKKNRISCAAFTLRVSPW